MTITPPLAVCGICADARSSPLRRDGGVRVPRGWRVLDDTLHCPACLARLWVLRAVTVPVAGPVGAAWTDLRVALAAGWRSTTAAANYMLTELYVRDIRREPGQTKLPAMPKIYLYPEVRARWPELEPNTVAQLEQLVQRTYRKQRYELLWTRSRTLATMRYPVPIPVPAASWSLERCDQSYVISARIGGQRWRLRLRGGPHMRHQRPLLAAVASGAADYGALTLRQITAHAGDHRTGDTRQSRLLATIPAWIRREARAGTGVLVIELGGPDTLLAERDGEWAYRGDHVRRLIVQYARRVQHIRSDQKAVLRRGLRWPDGVRELTERLTRQRDHALDSWLHQAARAVVDHARRVRAARLVLLAPGGPPEIPWSRLATRIADKAGVLGIEVASGLVMSDAPEPLDRTEEV